MGIDIEQVDTVAMVRVKFGRANAMSAAMLKGLEVAFTELARTDTRAVVLTGDGKAFSAGLALPDLIGLDRLKKP